MSDAQNSGKLGVPFTKGDQRINKGGRPKGYASFRAKFRTREKTDELREEVYAMAMNRDSKPSERLMAIRLYWEYGWGKPPNAPDDNDALRQSGSSIVDKLTRDEMLDIAKGEDEPKG